MGAYEDFFKNTRVSWLRKANPQKYFKAFGQVFDELIAKGVTALKTSRLDQCDVSALDAHARNSNLKRARNESDASLRAYLQTRWEVWAAAGTSKRIVDALKRIGYPRARVVTWYDLILRGVSAPFGGGYQTIAGANPNGGVSYIYAGRTDPSNIDPYIVRHKAGIGSKVYFITDPSETYLDVYIPPGIAANEVVLEVNTRAISGLPYSRYVGAFATGNGSGIPGFGNVTLTIPYWSYFYVEIDTPNGFLGPKLWDDAIDTTYDYPFVYPPDWKETILPTIARINAIWVVAANDIWAGDDGGGIFHYDGTSWTSVTSPTIQPITGLWGSAANDIWGTTLNGNLIHYDGTSWSNVAGPVVGAQFTEIWGTAANNIWVVGVIFGKFAYYDGTNWSLVNPVSMTPPPILYSIWGTAANNIWAVGSGGNIFYYDGTSWSFVVSVGMYTLHSVWGTAANDIWAVGTGGGIFHYDGTSWTSVTSPVTQNLNAIWGTAANNIWAVGDNGKIVHYDGTSWTSVTSPTSVQLQCIAGITANNIWAGGAFGRLLHYAPYTGIKKVFSGATGNLWDGGSTWDLQEPYVGAIGDIIEEIRKWKSPCTSCRFVRIQVGKSFFTIPVCEDVEYDANGNLIEDFYSQNY